MAEKKVRRSLFIYSYTSDENVIDNAKKSINGIQSLLFFVTYWILQLVLLGPCKMNPYTCIILYFFCYFVHFIRFGILKCNRTLAHFLSLLSAGICVVSPCLRAYHSPYVFT